MARDASARRWPREACRAAAPLPAPGDWSRGARIAVIEPKRNDRPGGCDTSGALGGTSVPLGWNDHADAFQRNPLADGRARGGAGDLPGRARDPAGVGGRAALEGRRPDRSRRGRRRRRIRSKQRAGRRLLLDDERGHHPEHPVLALGVREDVAVEGPRAGLLALDDHVPALARVHPEGVAEERLGRAGSRRGRRPASASRGDATGASSIPRS